MANVIQRILKIVLDKAAAKKAESDAKKSVGVIEGSIGGLERTIKRIGGLLATAFGVRALLRFGESSVKEAGRAEQAWRSLGNTVDNMGGSFLRSEKDLRALAEAFEDATTHGNDDYARSLDELIVLTGDTAASITNMGLVANVAAKFFNGELSPAVTLVGKVMNGIVTPLQRLGIHVESAQQGLDVLASRSFGAAEKRAQTFAGQLDQLNARWLDFKRDLGFALIAGGEGVNLLDMLKGAVQQLDKWVNDNRDTIRQWVTGALRFAIDGLKDLGRAFTTFLQTIGKAPFTLGTPSFVPAKTASGIEGQITVLEGQRKQLEAERAKLLQTIADTEAAVKKAGGSMVGLGAPGRAARQQNLDDLTEQLRSVNDQLDLVEKNATTAQDALSHVGEKGPEKPDLFGQKPVLSKGGLEEGEDAKAIREALKAFEQQSKGADTLAQLLGRDFDALKAKAAALTTVMTALGEHGVGPTSPKMQEFAAQLRNVGTQIAERDLEQGLADVATRAATLGPTFDETGARLDVLQKHFDDLVALGLSPLDPALIQAGESLEEFRKRAAGEAGFRELTLSLDQMRLATIGVKTGFDASGEAITAAQQHIADLGMEADLVQEQLLRLWTEGLRPGDDAFDRMAAALRVVRAELQHATAEARVLTAVSKLAGEVVGAAIDGGLAPFARAKAKANLIRAAEEAAEGTAALLSIFGAINAPAHFQAAAQFTVIAGLWSTLAHGGGGGGSASLAGGRGASSAASGRATSVPPEIKIYLTGPGFDALNPAVQKVVLGAAQNAREVYGAHSKVTIQRTP